MGAGASSLIDDLHTSAQMADEVAADRKLAALRSVQELGKDPLTAVQIIEQGGVQPLLQCYNATHPLVRMEAAKALAILAQQPSNQLEMGQDDLLPRYHPALLTASLEFCEHAMALMAELAKPEVNRMKLAHEGLLGPIAAGITAPREALQLHALAALARLCEKPQIAVLATQRGILPSLLRAARSPEAAVKLAVVRVLTGIADCGENMSAFITSGALIFLMGCTYCGRELQLAVAKCLEGLLRQVYEGTAELTEREANMLAVMSAIEVSPERISDDDAMEIQVRRAVYVGGLCGAGCVGRAVWGGLCDLFCRCLACGCVLCCLCDLYCSHASLYTTVLPRSHHAPSLTRSAHDLPAGTHCARHANGRARA